MNDLYLIAHLVRGEATFDVAVRLEEGSQSDPGPWWITSVGWRAWPYWTHPLGMLLVETEDAIMHLILPKVPDIIAVPDYILKQKPREAYTKPMRGKPIDLEELGL
jgi:hypothetical protein